MGKPSGKLSAPSPDISITFLSAAKGAFSRSVVLNAIALRSEVLAGIGTRLIEATSDANDAAEIGLFRILHGTTTTCWVYDHSTMVIATPRRSLIAWTTRGLLNA